MATTYTTVQGDTWDSAARAIYGDEIQAQTLLTAKENIRLLDYQIFPSGVVITAPDPDPDTITYGDLPDWRKDIEE